MNLTGLKKKKKKKKKKKSTFKMKSICSFMCSMFPRAAALGNTERIREQKWEYRFHWDSSYDSCVVCTAVLTPSTGLSGTRCSKVLVLVPLTSYLVVYIALLTVTKRQSWCWLMLVWPCDYSQRSFFSVCLLFIGLWYCQYWFVNLSSLCNW